MPMNVAFVGLGIMGAPMARNLLAAGYPLSAYDLHPERLRPVAEAGGRAAVSAADAAAGAEVVITMVQNGPQSEAAILGAAGVLEGTAAGSLICDMSSIAPTVSQRLAAACAAREIGFLDAPVSGGEPGAVAGELAIMVGGEVADFERARPLFEVLGRSAVLCGGHGAGNVTKLANQICVGANIHALAEALALAVRAGVDPQTVFDAIKGGLAGSNVMNAKAPMMIDRRFAPGFRIELHRKDIDNAMETARSLDLPLPVTASLQQALTSLVRSGHGGEDHAAILRYVETLGLVTVERS